jgi:hypothetical protein
MHKDLFKDFLISKDTLRIYRGETLVFSSDKDRLVGLMQFIDKPAGKGPYIIFDKVLGNAATQLGVKAGCNEAYSPLGSELAIETLKKYKIVYHLSEVVPYIQRDDGKGMCPMEKLSIGKTPEEFYKEMKTRLSPKKES